MLPEWNPNQPAAKLVPRHRFRLGFVFHASGHNVDSQEWLPCPAPREGVSAEDAKPAGWAPPWIRPSHPPPPAPRPPGLTHSRRLLRGGSRQKQQQHGTEEHHPARRQPEDSRRHGGCVVGGDLVSGDSTSTPT